MIYAYGDNGERPVVAFEVWESAEHVRVQNAAS